MRYYIHVPRQEFVSGIGGGPVATPFNPESLSRTSGTDEFLFIGEDANGIEAPMRFPEDTIFSFGLKRVGKFESEFVVSWMPNTFVRPADPAEGEEVGFYRARFNGDSTEARTLLLTPDGNVNNDMPYVDLAGELTWKLPTDPVEDPPNRTKTFYARLNNIYTQGSEGAVTANPAYPSAEDIALKSEARDADFISEGILDPQFGGSLALNGSKTPNAHAVLQAGTRPLRVMGLGDSVWGGAVYPALDFMRNAIGSSGLGDEEAPGSDFAKSTIAEWFRPVFHLTGSDVANMYSHVPSSQAPAWDTLKVTYVTRPGGGSFKVSTNAYEDNTGAGYIDRVTIDTDTEDLGCDTYTLTLPYAENRHVRLTNLSGTCDVIRVECSRMTNYPGVYSYAYPLSGFAFAAWTGNAIALRRGVLDAIAPDVILVRFLDEDSILPDHQTLLADLAAIGRLETTDIVAISGSKVNSTDEVEAQRKAQVDDLRSIAVQLGVGFVDLWTGSNPANADGVHSLASGYAFETAELLRQLGWLQIPRVAEQIRPNSTRYDRNGNGRFGAWEFASPAPGEAYLCCNCYFFGSQLRRRKSGGAALIRTETGGYGVLDFHSFGPGSAEDILDPPNSWQIAVVSNGDVYIGGTQGYGGATVIVSGDKVRITTSKLPTSDPSSAGQLWRSGTALQVSV